MSFAINRRKLFLILSLGLLFALSVVSTARAIPDPTGYMVNDWVYLLTYSEEEDLEGLCRWIEDQTTVEI